MIESTEFLTGVFVGIAVMYLYGLIRLEIYEVRQNNLNGDEKK